jgi:hypothetical protein
MVSDNMSEWIEQKIDEESRRTTLGIVQKVMAHTDPNDKINHQVNVKLINSDEEPRNVQIHQSRMDSVYVPRKGDFVAVSFLNSKTQDPYISGYAYSSQQRAPLAEAGHWRHRFGDESPYLFVEAEKADHSAGAPNVVRLAKKPDGLSDPSTKVEIDDSGSTTQVNIETDGDINISAGGNVVIDEGGTAKKVLTEDAVFEYEDTGDTSDGSAGTTTKTTTKVSNNEVTETEIE